MLTHNIHSFLGTSVTIARIPPCRCVIFPLQLFHRDRLCELVPPQKHQGCSGVSMPAFQDSGRVCVCFVLQHDYFLDLNCEAQTENNNLTGEGLVSACDKIDGTSLSFLLCTHWQSPFPDNSTLHAQFTQL